MRPSSFDSAQPCPSFIYSFFFCMSLIVFSILGILLFLARGGVLLFFLVLCFSPPCMRIFVPTFFILFIFRRRTCWYDSFFFDLSATMVLHFLALWKLGNSYSSSYFYSYFCLSICNLGFSRSYRVSCKYFPFHSLFIFHVRIF